MRTSSNIVAGQFLGAEIEPGTFHHHLPTRFGAPPGPSDCLRLADRNAGEAVVRPQGPAGSAPFYPDGAGPNPTLPQAARQEDEAA